MTQPTPIRRDGHRPRLLDLFSCAGGAAMGYHRAGFEVTGVDIAEQPNYPFGHHVADAVEFAAEHAAEYDFIHASPPCQTHSALTKGTNKGRAYPDFLGPIRDVLTRSGRPFVIENVAGAPLRRDLVLCGEMFGLGVIRHRVFEVHGITVQQLAHRPHRGRVAGMRHGQWFTGPYYAVYGEGGGKGTVAQWQQAMGIPWTNVRREIAEAIPPAYTHWIGTQALTHEGSAAA
ncbi:DNA cytosine methyltransferase [Streptomyces sp. NPDC087218]|uniref:DNA cytosine methyltransferase n=1 Tax=Streptomyces sp. NPDC087218 TaxID=3365769 RepID=UPI0037F879ED